MPWAKRSYSKRRIDRAGRDLVELPKNTVDRVAAVSIVDNWRASHAYPLQIIKMTLLRRAKKISRDALIAQRLKRRPSIEIKLQDNPHMKLSQMQDIGGCRAVMPRIEDVHKLVKKYKKSHAKSPKKTRSMWDGSEDFDYIRNPKPDGYRSVHLIFRFQSSSPERNCYNGQRIEIQIRSQLQHLWATTVETAQVFTGQALKSKIKRASEDWLRFFALASGAFALREKCPPIPGVPQNKQDLIRELINISNRQKIIDSLWGWSNALQFWEEKQNPEAKLFLLVLNPTDRTLTMSQFMQEDMARAQEEYEKQEKLTENNPDIQVVLVSVDSADALRKAYPNYYANTGEFIAAVTNEVNDAIPPSSRQQGGTPSEETADGI